MIRAFIVYFVFGALYIFSAHNQYQMSQSIERCEELVQEIHQHADNLKNL